jgi:hypothetical protein
MENKSIQMSGKPDQDMKSTSGGSEEINRFLEDYATFKDLAAKELNKREVDGTVGSIKEENILCLYKLFVLERNRRAARGSGGNLGYKKWSSGSNAKWNEQPASERQKGLIKKLVDRGRVKFEGGTSIETMTKKSASEILDTVFGKRPTKS